MLIMFMLFIPTQVVIAKKGEINVGPIIQQERSHATIRVLTYNIHHGEGMDGKVDLSRIASVMKRLKPDIIALQEVDRYVPRSGNVDQAAELAELMGMHVAFGKAISLAGGEYGVATLSRYPILSSKTTLLPMARGGEQRVLLTSQIAPARDIPPITFTGTHLEVDPKSIQAAQVDVIMELYGTSDPYILAGDLNATPNSNTIKTLRSKWVDATAEITDWTNEEDGKIDYVMYGARESWYLASTRILKEDVASDHRPVLAVLEWRGNGSEK
jgi:endonuclease/exonuclease/phosphatase family metal-dependent hydrolase